MIHAGYLGNAKLQNDGLYTDIQWLKHDIRRNRKGLSKSAGGLLRLFGRIVPVKPKSAPKFCSHLYTVRHKAVSDDWEGYYLIKRLLHRLLPFSPIHKEYAIDHDN